ncbi:MAG: hypothetical protein LBT03_02895, partial [Holosporales bacterium]|nr:hypothetical protein [Holosporales bacterium]
YEKAAYDYGNDVSVAKREGREEGEAIGELKKARETAARMLSKGMLVEDISDITGLSMKEVQRLKNEK